MERLTRDELEAILAYEISRIGSLDVALSSWTVAVTTRANELAHHDLMSPELRSPLRRLGERLQRWALRGQARARDRVAISFTRHPAALVRALGKLAADRSSVRTTIAAARATAPLWIEYPTSAIGTSRSLLRLARESQLEGRITELCRMANRPTPALHNRELDELGRAMPRLTNPVRRQQWMAAAVFAIFALGPFALLSTPIGPLGFFMLPLAFLPVGWAARLDRDQKAAQARFDAEAQAFVWPSIPTDARETTESALLVSGDDEPR